MARFISQLGCSRTLLNIAALLFAAQLLSGCEADSTFVFNPDNLHGPLGITIVPTANIALVVSTNFDFANSASDPQEPGGAIHVIDLTTNTLVPAATVQLPNFGGQISVDVANKRIFVADRDNDLLRIYKYDIPGTDGNLISIALETTLEVGEDPFSLLLTAPTGTAFRKLFVANVFTDDLSLIDADSLEIVELNPEDTESEALPLNEISIGSIDFTNQLIRPNRLLAFGSDDLALLSASAAGLIYVIDTKNNAFEAFIDLLELDISPQLNGLAITNEKLVYVASHGIQGVVVLDLSTLSDNGIDNEVIEPSIIQTIPTGSDIEALTLSQDGSKVYAASFTDNSVLVLAAATGFVIKEISVGQGPTEMALTDDGSRLLVTNFLSDQVSVINTTTDTLETTIE